MAPDGVDQHGLVQPDGRTPPLLSRTTNTHRREVRTFATMSTLREVKAWIDEQLPAADREVRRPRRRRGRPGGRRGRRRRRRRAEQGDRRRGDAGLRLPDRLDHQALDQHAGHAARRRGPARPRRAGPRPTCPSSGSRDEAAAAQITTRQLLSHTAGFEGDIFTDTGRGDDCVEKYVGVAARGARSSSPPGELFSYNNAGFCVLGRLVEVLRGKPYDDVPARAPLRAARPDPRRDQPVRGDPVPRRGRPRRARAGRRLPARADLGAGPLQRAGRLDARDAPARPARFAQMHLDDGKAADGTQVLAPGTAARDARPRRSTCPTSA